MANKNAKQSKKATGKKKSSEGAPEDSDEHERLVILFSTVSRMRTFSHSGRFKICEVEQEGREGPDVQAVAEQIRSAYFQEHKDEY